MVKLLVEYNNATDYNNYPLIEPCREFFRHWIYSNNYDYEVYQNHVMAYKRGEIMEEEHMLIPFIELMEEKYGVYIGLDGYLKGIINLEKSILLKLQWQK